MQEEFNTVRMMIDLYCRGQHGSKDGLCPECSKLFAYVAGRLEKCQFKENKPWCSKCLVHCYKPDKGDRIKAVMRYSGLRMLYRPPILTGKHYLKGFK